MRVWELLELLGKFVVFVCKYGFSKCMRTAVCGLAVMLLLLTWHCWRKRRAGRSADLGFYSWLLLFPAAFTGMSRIFFQRWSIGLQGGIHILGDTWVSGGYFVILLALLGWWLAGKHVLSKRVCKLYCWYAPKMSSHRGTQDWQHCIRRVTDGDRRGLARWYLKRARVYISGQGISPYCGGIFRPYIVMPDLYLEPMGESSAAGEEQRCRGSEQRCRASEQRCRASEQRCRASEQHCRGIEQFCREREQEESRRNFKTDGEPGYWGRGLTEQGKTLLCHELLHLKSGHILWINLFALLRIYWWFNPLVYLCEKLLRQDMEQACDEGCLYYTGVSEREYGRLLLAMAARQENMRLAGAATFLRDRDYHSLRNRIGSLRGKCGLRKYRLIHRNLTLGCAALLALGILAVGATSYPRYTRMQELVLYDEELRLICNDTPQLREAVQVVDGFLQIDPERMDACLKELEFEGEYVYLSFDTIMKVPGSGGCGNVGMIEPGNYEDIFYLRAETWENDLLEFCLKYLL